MSKRPANAGGRDTGGVPGTVDRAWRRATGSSSYGSTRNAGSSPPATSSPAISSTGASRSRGITLSRSISGYRLRCCSPEFQARTGTPSAPPAQVLGVESEQSLEDLWSKHVAGRSMYRGPGTMRTRKPTLDRQHTQSPAVDLVLAGRAVGAHLDAVALVRSVTSGPTRAPSCRRPPCRHTKVCRPGLCSQARGGSRWRCGG